VTTESSLINLPVWCAIEWEPHPLQLNHRRDRFASEYFSRVLIGQVVATFDGVEHVPLPVVFFHIAKRSADSTLGCARV